jgi:hypothetical protein
MGFWDKSLRIFKSLCENATQSVRQLAQQTGLSKSSVHRLRQAMERRNGHPESWWWETEDGRRWLTRLVVATLSTFGLKRGVGLETLRKFFTPLHLETQVGCSPAALGGVMQALEAAMLATTAAWEPEGVATGERREIIGAVDATFLPRMMLVFMDLVSGSRVFEEVAEDRSWATWQARVEERLKVLGTEGLDLVSDRAKALIQRAEKGVECLSMPDCFPVVHDIIKSYALAIGRHVRPAHQELAPATETRTRLPAAHEAPEAQALVEAQQAEVQPWKEGQGTYRQHLATRSLTLHPFRLSDSTPQTSDQVASRWHAGVEAIEALVRHQQWPARHPTMQKVRKQIPALAALVDCWWQGVRQDVEPFLLSPLWRPWVHECLLPLVSWAYHIAQTRCTRRKTKLV